MKLKKPKFWDYKKPNLFAILLYPVAIIVEKIISLKKKTNKNNFKIKTICFGNIYIGGTGKTSLCIKLNNILNRKNIKSCFVKKYYKNQYDEQRLLDKYGKLFLKTKRVDAIKRAEEENYDIAILDDGLQDNSINPDINFICFNTHNWIGNGMTIPAGPLREKITNLAKYNQIFLNGNLENLEIIKKQILKINPKINIHIGKYVPININDFKKEDNYLVFSGIGNHETFISMLRNEGLNIIKILEFPDHFQYNENDVNKIINKAKDLKCKIITTEKDFLRLKNMSFDEIKFIKSEIKILDEEKFLRAIF